MPKKVSFMTKNGPVQFVARPKKGKNKNRKNRGGKRVFRKNSKKYFVDRPPSGRKPYLRYTNPAYSPWATTNANANTTSQAAWDAFDAAAAKAGVKLPTNVKGAWGSDVTDALDKWNTIQEDKAYKEDPSSNPWRQAAEKAAWDKKGAENLAKLAEKEKIDKISDTLMKGWE